ncbi:MAG: hypothetical protein ACREOV_13820 [Candidatus Dormibacteraceae bacterium]
MTLDGERAPKALWWVSVHGIYRPSPPATLDGLAPLGAVASRDGRAGEGQPLHPRYRLPARWFAYVGVAADTHTWKLPYLLETGAPDARRLPMAIQAIMSDYRGEQVRIPREAVADVLVRLRRAARYLRRLPCQSSAAGAAYVAIHSALEQVDRLAEVGCCVPARPSGD